MDSCVQMTLSIADGYDSSFDLIFGLFIITINVIGRPYSFIITYNLIGQYKVDNLDIVFYMTHGLLITGLLGEKPEIRYVGKKK